MKKILAILLSAALLMGFAGCGSLENVLGAPVTYAESNTAQYNKILSDAGIDHSAPVFGENVASYAMADPFDYVYCADYVYKNDVVTSWAETTYIPVKGQSEEEILNLERQLRLELDNLDLLECCSLRFNHVGDYLKVTCVFSEVDKEENYSALYLMNFTTEKAAVSMKVSEDMVLEGGYVKK